MLEAARRLFLQHGYATTTVGVVAAEAGVSVETVYKAFANKAGLVKAVFDVAVAGDDEPIPLLQREFVRANMAEPDPRKKLLAYGEHMTKVAPATCPIQLVVRAAAATDPGVGADMGIVAGRKAHGHDRLCPAPGGGRSPTQGASQ